MLEKVNLTVRCVFQQNKKSHKEDSLQTTFYYLINYRFRPFYVMSISCLFLLRNSCVIVSFSNANGDFCRALANKSIFTHWTASFIGITAWRTFGTGCKIKTFHQTTCLFKKKAADSSSNHRQSNDYHLLHIFTVLLRGSDGTEKKAYLKSSTI